MSALKSAALLAIAALIVTTGFAQAGPSYTIKKFGFFPTAEWSGLTVYKYKRESNIDLSGEGKDDDGWKPTAKDEGGDWEAHEEHQDWGSLIEQHSADADEPDYKMDSAENPGLPGLQQSSSGQVSHGGLTLAP